MQCTESPCSKSSTYKPAVMHMTHCGWLPCQHIAVGCESDQAPCPDLFAADVVCQMLKELSTVMLLHMLLLHATNCLAVMPQTCSPSIVLILHRVHPKLLYILSSFLSLPAHALYI